MPIIPLVEPEKPIFLPLNVYIVEAHMLYPGLTDEEEREALLDWRRRWFVVNRIDRFDDEEARAAEKLRPFMSPPRLPEAHMRRNRDRFFAGAIAGGIFRRALEDRSNAGPTLAKIKAEVIGEHCARSRGTDCPRNFTVGQYDNESWGRFRLVGHFWASLDPNVSQDFLVPPERLGAFCAKADQALEKAAKMRIRNAPPLIELGGAWRIE